MSRFCFALLLTWLGAALHAQTIEFLPNSELEEFLNSLATPENESSHTNGGSNQVSASSNLEAYGFEWEVVQEHHSGDLSGMMTCRLYFNMANPLDYLSSVSGDSGNPWLMESTSSPAWFNDPNFGEPFPHYYYGGDNGSGGGISPQFFQYTDLFPFGAGAFDSWMTVGSQDVTEIPAIGDVWGDLSPVTSLDTAPGVNFAINDPTGGAIYAPFPGIAASSEGHLAFAGEDLRVLVGQFTTTGQISGQAQVQVFANGDQGEEVRDVFEIPLSPCIPPTVSLSGDLTGVCSGDSAYVQVLPDPNQVIVNWDWNYDPLGTGAGGDVLSENGSEAYLTAGAYQVSVTDELGCIGTEIFTLPELDPVIPDLEIDALCLEALGTNSVSLAGGYSGQPAGYLNLNLFSSVDGWLGSYLSIDIIHMDGSSTNSIVTMSEGDFLEVSDWPSLALSYGDSIEITYVRDNPDNDPYLSFELFNCTETCIAPNCTSFNDLTFGEGLSIFLFSGPALCEWEPVAGSWEEASGLGNNDFSSPNTFNTEWTANDYGSYELCFTDDVCGTTTCYDVEVNEPPTIEFVGDSVLLACDDVNYLALDLEVFVSDPAGTATINWPFPGNDDVLTNQYNFDAYFSGQFVVTASNGCGEASDQVVYTAIPEPVLYNDYLCGEGPTYELDPIAGDQNTDLEYGWTYNGNDVDDVNDNEWVVDATGWYCVTVPDEGCPSSFDNTDCAFITFVTEIDVNVFEGGSISICDGSFGSSELAVLGVNAAFAANYPEYTVTWPGNIETTLADDFEWTIPENIFGEEDSALVCVTASDPYGCGAQEFCGWVTLEGCCNDPEACNYSSSGTDPSVCLYLDECGICGGGGVLNDCCNCSCDSLDALGVCGGACLSDEDANGVCDNEEVYGCTYELAENYNLTATRDDGSCAFPCEGQVNTNIFDWDGDYVVTVTDFLMMLSVYGDTDVDLDGVWDSGDDCVDANACNYATDPSEPCAYIDVLGICGGGCTADDDEDGVCDDVDDCVGVIDECGVCNGPGPTEVVIEDITIMYDSVYAEQIDTWFVFEVGADTTFSYTCAPPSFITCGDPVSYQGYDYATVLIGDQCWFAENLRSADYENGEAIISELNIGAWLGIGSSGTVSVYGETYDCFGGSPDFDPCNPILSLTEYGRLYSWHAVNDLRGLCPIGWHVPTDGEWTILTDYLGGDSIAGVQMRTESGWNGNIYGTNTSGFSGLPAGSRSYPDNGPFSGAGSFAGWWSSSSDGEMGWRRYLTNCCFNPAVFRGASDYRSQASIRCVQDAE